MVYVFSRGSVSVYPTLHRKLDLLLPKRGWREGSVMGGLEKKQSVSCKSTVPSLGTICILSRYPRDAASLPPSERGGGGGGGGGGVSLDAHRRTKSGKAATRPEDWIQQTGQTSSF